MANLLNISPPAADPRLNRLKSVAGAFAEMPRLGASEGFEWESPECGLPGRTKAGCLTADPTVAADKEFDGVLEFQSIGKPFAQYAGVSCWMNGGDGYVDAAKRKLENGEEDLVEAVLWDWAKAAPSPGSAASVAEAVGAAEQQAAASYAFRPTLLIGTANALTALAAGVLVRKDGKLITALGTPVVVSPYFTGGVAIVGSIIVNRTPIVATAEAEYEKNTASAIAEATYAVGVHCNFRHFITV